MLPTNYAAHPADRKRLNKVKPNTPLKFIPVQFEKGWRKEQKVEINKTIKRQIQEAKELADQPWDILINKTDKRGIREAKELTNQPIL